MNIDYQSHLLNLKMKILGNFKKLSTRQLKKIIREGNTINRVVAGMEMQIRGGEDIINYAILQCSHKNYKFREIGAFILGQICIQDHQKLLEIIKLLVDNATYDKSIRVRYTAVYSLGHRCARGFKDYELIMPSLAKAVDNLAASVRMASAFALAFVKTRDAHPLLEKLLRDPDEDVRDWAGFAVNTSGADSPSIRDALVKMLDDSFKEARYEAIEALASRHDKRVIHILKCELRKESIVTTIIEATSNFSDPEFILILEELLKKFDDKEGIIKVTIDKLKSHINNSP
jgi:HEAT repeat protein